MLVTRIAFYPHACIVGVVILMETIPLCLLLNKSQQNTTQVYRNYMFYFDVYFNPVAYFDMSS